MPIYEVDFYDQDQKNRSARIAAATSEDVDIRSSLLKSGYTVRKIKKVKCLVASEELKEMRKPKSLASQPANSEIRTAP